MYKFIDVSRLVRTSRYFMSTLHKFIRSHASRWFWQIRTEVTRFVWNLYNTSQGLWNNYLAYYHGHNYLISGRKSRARSFHQAIWRFQPRGKNPRVFSRALANEKREVELTLFSARTLDDRWLSLLSERTNPSPVSLAQDAQRRSLHTAGKLLEYTREKCQLRSVRCHVSDTGW